MNTNVAAVVVDKRRLLAQIADRKVRVVASESNEFAEALFGVLRERFGPRVAFLEWSKALAELDDCELTIREFLEREATR